jgi:hypothetical protein
MTQTRFQLTKQAARTLKARAIETLGAAGAEFSDLKGAVETRVTVDSQRLTLALAGVYEVGKSSLIAALTGLEVPTGGGVTTTEVHEYPYGDLLLVDMPGTLSGEAGQDQIAKQAITDADLLLFVISNELFNPESLPFFMRAAVDLDKRQQMLLVVNKFDRFNLAGRTPEEAVQFISGVLAEEIKPLPVEGFGPVVVSTRDYLVSRKEEDPEKAARRLASSRFEELIAAIDQFCTRNGVMAQQVRPLQQLLDVLNEAVNRALVDDGSRSRATDLVRRQMFALNEERGRARAELGHLRSEARSRLVQPAEKLLKLLDDRASMEEMDGAAADVEQALQLIVQDISDKLGVLHVQLARDLVARLDEIDCSALAQQVRAEFEVDLKRPELVSQGVGLSAKTRKAVAEGARKAAKAVTENSKQVTEVLARIFKFFGGKFKPWGKVKLDRWVQVGGKVAGPLVAIAEAYFNYRAEEAKEKAERQLRTLRAEMRATFADIARQFDAVLQEQSDALLTQLYDNPLEDASALAREIVAGGDQRTALAQQLSGLVEDVRLQLEFAVR